MKLALTLVLAALQTTILATGGCRSGESAPGFRARRIRACEFDHGGIVRGPTDRRELALIFTGGDHGEGCGVILDALNAHDARASFFLTGSFLTDPDRSDDIRRMVDDGHCVGPHSHAHLLYAAWEDRAKSLVTRAEFHADLERNLDGLRRVGAPPSGETIYFVPPYEWYNEQHVEWARERSVILINFTRGTGSHRDWIPEGHAGFASSQQIVDDILAAERRSPNGLNGHLLLLHLGSLRHDKVYDRLGELLDVLSSRGYRFLRVDELLRECDNGERSGRPEREGEPAT